MAGVVETLRSLSFPEDVDEERLLQGGEAFSRAVEFLLDAIDTPAAASFRSELGAGAMLEALGLAAPGEGESIVLGEEVDENEAWALLDDLAALAGAAALRGASGTGAREDEVMGMVARQSAQAAKHGGSLFSSSVAGLFAFPLGDADGKAGKAAARGERLDPGMLDDCLEMVEGEHRLAVQEVQRADGFLKALVRQRAAFDGPDADTLGAAGEVARQAEELRVAALDFNDLYQEEVRGVLHRIQKPEQHAALGAVARRVRETSDRAGRLLANLERVRVTTGHLASVRAGREESMAPTSAATAQAAQGALEEVGGDA
mmetsp:Transcript_59240/g.140903  ORF Transcript_59240/g.140903 Transcript_59240/m.140903 type:complete len:317 (-) Transcript_59240:92-1042(-)